jgi:hypothetical protein
MLGFCQTGTAEGTLEPDESPKRKTGMLRVRIGWAIDGHFLKGSSYPRVDTATGVAMVVKLDGVSWEPTGEPRPSEGDVLAAGRFRLVSGRATLSMLTGVVLDVEGPADFELVASDRVLCRRGRIRARVPAGAEGFLVLGPSSAVIDLGTEFGLNVGTDGKMRGQIFKGKLEAALLSAEGTHQRINVPSCLLLMLSFMEQQPLFNAVNFSHQGPGNWNYNDAWNGTVQLTKLNVLICPSDQDRANCGARGTSTPAGTNYQSNAGADAYAFLTGTTSPGGPGTTNTFSGPFPSYCPLIKLASSPPGQAYNEDVASAS